MTPWRSKNSDPADYEVLVEGVPAYMVEPLRGWIGRAIQRDPGGWARDFDSAVRNKLELLGTAAQHGGNYILDVALRRPDPLEFVDFLVYHFADEDNEYYDPFLVEHLENLLEYNGSAWRIGIRGDGPGLERRVPEGVALAADEVMSSTNTAGELLAEAWRAAFGRVPDEEEAFEKAIKAVEEAGASVVSPKNAKATLGTMARDIETQGNWALELIENPNHPTNDVVAKMVRSLWEGQESRHGGNGYRKPTQGEAEAAVLLAVPLVQWFSSGAVKRR